MAQNPGTASQGGALGQALQRKHHEARPERDSDTPSSPRPPLQPGPGRGPDHSDARAPVHPPDVHHFDVDRDGIACPAMISGTGLAV